MMVELSQQKSRPKLQARPYMALAGHVLVGLKSQYPRQWADCVLVPSNRILKEVKRYGGHQTILPATGNTRQLITAMVEKTLCIETSCCQSELSLI